MAATNTLHYGDNLDYIQDMASESVDLVYLDPPFNSQASYNLLFKTPQGDAVEAQTSAFRDTWWWDVAAEEAFDRVLSGGGRLAGLLKALRSALGESDMMAYLAMMAARLTHLERVLTRRGSLFLHCDPSASHYLKLLLDMIFEPRCYRAEITWKRTGSHGNVTRNFGAVTDTVFFYTKTDDYVWNQQYAPFEAAYIEKKFRWADPDERRWQSVTLRNPAPRPNLRYPFTASNGETYHPHANGWVCRRGRLEEYDREGRLHFPSRAGGQLRLKMYLDESPGVRLSNLWTDIPAVNSQAKERLGYPTQKPLALLERIIRTATDDDGVVFDPFCGCGTAIEAAERLGRRWIGVDITHHAIEVIEGRMREQCPNAAYDVTGRPVDLGSAHDLARRDKYEFQWWANWLVGVQNYRERKKGADRGIDGIIYFRNGPMGVGQAIVSVKGGKSVAPEMISALRGTVEREDAQLGLFVCLAEPTARMRQEAASAGFTTTAQGKFPRVQIVTISDVLEGRLPAMPAPIEADAFRQPLRPKRSRTAAKPDPQLSFALPIPGGAAVKPSKGVAEHLSGQLLAALSR